MRMIGNFLWCIFGGGILAFLWGVVGLICCCTIIGIPSAKTASYNVRANYNFVKDRKNQMQRQFDGYVCVHRLKIEFDYNTELLGKALSTISSSLADPQLDISFTVKDKDAVNEELLSNAAKNARKKAETLCSASGAALGKGFSPKAC